MTAPTLTAADLRALRLMFSDAHRHGRMCDDEHEKTVIVLNTARERQAARVLTVAQWGGAA